MMKTVIVALLIVSTIASSTFLGKTCSKKGEKCGHEMEGQSKCCSGLTCNLGSLPGAPGVCGENVCSVEGELCGHEFAHKSCCSGLTCTVENPGMLGARGKCKSVQAPTCLSENQACGHELEGRVSCCDGLTCQTALAAPIGAKGLCKPEAPAMSVFVAATCSAKGEKCGHQMEGQTQCCNGLTCKFGALHGAPGVCVESVCAVEDEVCGHEFSHKSCCSGLTCTIENTGMLGARGKCKSATVLFGINESTNYRCGGPGETCGLQFEGGIICCPNHECVFPEENVPGSKGVCLEKKKPTCASEGQVCGHELEGSVQCCSGYTCATVSDSPIGAPGVCLPAPQSVFVEKNVCATEGQICGHELEGNVKCCTGFTCTTVPDAPIGASGVCLAVVSELKVVDELEVNVCATEGQVCGHELEGTVKCCSGYSCTTVPDAPIGAPGICLKDSIPSIVEFRQNICASQGQVCGHELEGTVKCCTGFSCKSVPDAPIGAHGICFKDVETPIAEISESLCAVQGEVCGHELEGTVKCCSGYTCTTVPDSPIGAPGICMKDDVIDFSEKKNLCAIEGETCGHEREGQKGCCEGLVCFLGDVAPLGSTGVCTSQITI